MENIKNYYWINLKQAKRNLNIEIKKFINQQIFLNVILLKNRPKQV